MGGFGATGHQAAAITHDLDHPFLPTYLNLENSILVRKQHFNTKESGQEKNVVLESLSIKGVQATQTC